jgi:hypothetical protein
VKGLGSAFCCQHDGAVRGHGGRPGVIRERRPRGLTLRGAHYKHARVTGPCPRQHVRAA